MLSLGRNSIEHNVKTKRNAKSLNASLSKFQDFLAKTLPKPIRSKSKMFTPNKTQIQRLNFSNTATTSAFLPPKSIDKYRLSSTNRGYETIKYECMKIGNSQKKQIKAYFMERQQQNSQLTRKQMKQKIETSAMQRFQQLFRKQTSIRGKVIEQQQTKRLVYLLENTSRRNSLKQPQQNLTKRARPNIIIAGSKKTLKSRQSQAFQENNCQIKRYSKFPVEFKNTVENFKQFQQERRSFFNSEKDKANKVELVKTTEKIIQVKNDFHHLQQVKKINQMRQNQQSTQEVKVQETKKQINYVEKQVVVEKKLQQQEKYISIVKDNQSKIAINELPTNSAVNSNKLFQQQFYILQLRTTDLNQKPQNKIKRQEMNNALHIRIDGQKDELKQQESDNMKIQVKNVLSSLSNTNSNNNSNFMSLKPNNRDPITIKGQRGAKVQEKINLKAPRQEDEYDDLDVVVMDNNKDLRKQVVSVKGQMNINPSRRKQSEVDVNRVSATSLADKIQKIPAKLEIWDIPDEDHSDKTQKRGMEGDQQQWCQQQQQNQQQQQKQQSQQQQQQQLQPADQLDYLICLVQNLGRYYNKSKQFYSCTESSMVEIVMNHKLAAYYTSQQFYYYLHFFISKLQINNKNQHYWEEFYMLSPGELEEALQDEGIVEAIEDLRNSVDVAKKLIKHTHEKARIYLRRQQKQLIIDQSINYNAKCLTYLREEFNGLYKLYKQRCSNVLAQRLCFLIEIYCIVKALNQQQTKLFQDMEDIGEQHYHQHLIDNMRWLQQT